MLSETRLLRPSTWPPLVLTAALFVAFAGALLGLAFGLLAAFTGESTPQLHTLAASRACFEERRMRTSAPRNDFVSQTALGGTIHVELEANGVTIDFGSTPSGAAQIEAAYRRFAPKGYPIDSLLQRRNDVVLLWRKGPTDDELRQVTRCLK